MSWITRQNEITVKYRINEGGKPSKAAYERERVDPNYEEERNLEVEGEGWHRDAWR